MTRSLHLLLVPLFISFLHQANAQNYTLNGDALSLGADCYGLTPESVFANGSVWYNDPINLNVPLDIQFTMNYGNLDANGADGMVFVMQTQGTSAIGFNGSGMGFQGFVPSFGIEFDTYSNNPQSDPVGNQNDPQYDHTAFLINGSVNHNSSSNIAGPVPISALSSNVEDGQDYTVNINWNPANQTIELYINCSLRLSQQIDLATTVFNGFSNVYWGFTGSTGGFYNLQQVCLSPTILIDDTSYAICEGANQELSAGEGLTNSYTWSPNTGLSSTNEQTVIASPQTSTTYTVNYQNLCGDFMSQTFEIQVLIPPDISIVESNYCGENPQPLEAIVPNTGTIEWGSSNGTIIGNDDDNPIQVQGSGTYFLGFTDEQGCTANDSIDIIFYPYPNAELGDPEIFICNEEPVELNIEIGPAATILWSTGEDTASIEVTQGVYTVSIEENNCMSTDAITVTNVNVENPNLGPDIEACQGQIVNLTSVQEAEWSTGEVSANIQVTQTGIFDATITEGVCSVNDQIQVTFFPPPNFSLGENVTICPNENHVFQTTSSVLWPDGNVSQSYTVTETSTVFATLTVGPCEVTDEVEVYVLEAPTLELGDDQTSCIGEHLSLIVPFYEENNYSWNTGEELPEISVNTSGTFSLLVENQCGSAFDSILVIFEECDHFIYAPNSFTPNGDGVNDFYLTSTFKIDTYSLMIFDRWGSLVFDTKDPNQPWDGSYQNSEYFLSDGLYLYKILYTVGSKEVKELFGHIMMLR